MDDRYYEYGYRLSNGTESWEIDHGTDGSWTAWDEENGIEAIDMYAGQQVAAIQRELERAGVDGVPIRRSITRTVGPVEAWPFSD